MGIGAAVVSVLGLAYSAYDDDSEKRKAKHAKSDIEKEEKRELFKAQKEAENSNEDRRRKMSMFGRKSTFSSFKNSETAKKKTLFGD